MSAEIYTDGSIYPNPGTGGYGAVIYTDDNRILKVWGKAHPTTNNRMELRAMIEALRICPDEPFVKIYSDSQYVVSTLNLKLNRWVMLEKNTKNGDLWQQLWDEINWRDWRIFHVRGHSGYYYNEVADWLAGYARTAQDIICEDDSTEVYQKLTQGE